MLKKLRISLWVLLALFVVCGGFLGWRTLHLPTTLPIHRVEVIGEYEFVDEETLEKAVIPYVATGFFNVNIQGAELALLKIPGISLASLRRVWPDKVEIQVVEKKAQATLPDGQIYAIDGTVFAPLQINRAEQQLLSQLPVFAGASEDLPGIAAFYHSAQALLIKNGFRVDFVGCDGLGSWTLGVSLPKPPGSNNLNSVKSKSSTHEEITQDNGLVSMMIIVGRDHMLEKLTRFSQNYSILEKTNQDKIPRLVDLRYNLGFAAEYSS